MVTTFSELQNEIDALAKTCLDKKLILPLVRIEFENNTDPSAYISFKESENLDRVSRYFWFADIENLLSEVKEYIDKIPSLEERNKTNYLKLVSAAVEFGKTAQIDDALINPLIEQMKKLSSNILTDERSANEK